jgi:hypothetical protein
MACDTVYSGKSWAFPTAVLFRAEENPTEADGQLSAYKLIESYGFCQCYTISAHMHNLLHKVHTTTNYLRGPIT